MCNIIRQLTRKHFFVINYIKMERKINPVVEISKNDFVGLFFLLQ